MENRLELRMPALGERVVCVEYPAIVRNCDAAVESLGGVRAVARAAKTEGHSAPLTLFLDDRTHPMYASKEASTGILLRVARPLHPEPGQESAPPSVTVVGRIDTTFRFNSLPSYHVLPFATGPDDRLHGPSRCKGNETPADLEPDGIERVLAAIPPDTGRVVQPSDTILKLHPKQPGKAEKQAAAAAQAADDPVLVPFNVLQVPQPSRADADDVEADYVASLLRDRPAITHAAFSAATWGKPRIGVAAQLGRAAYCFQDGPWAGLYIRRGWDPRTSRSAAHQMVQYRLPAGWRGNKAALQERGADRDAALRAIAASEITTGEGGGDEGELGPTVSLAVAAALPRVHSFESLPDLSFTQLQLCDLADDRIQAMLEAGPPEGVLCTKATGWLSEVQMTELKACIDSRFQALVAGVSGAELEERMARIRGDGHPGESSRGMGGPGVEMGELLIEDESGEDEDGELTGDGEAQMMF